jgi:23S rRNA (cytosine1962-C5)-methyltransferase
VTSLPVLVADPWADYALLDSGNSAKFERYGEITVVRPEPQALWRPRLPVWEPHATFVGGADEEELAARGGKHVAMAGRWRLDRPVPDVWDLAWRDVRFWASLTPFRHLGFFPDMAPHWDWLAARVQPGDGVLNLFGYTGVASLVAAQAGARVTHIDASKKAVLAARDNQALSRLEDAPIRWIIEDALLFAEREGRRGRRYQHILVDPPKFGRGPNGETWHLFEHLPALLAALAPLLDRERGGLVLTVYAIRASALALDIAVREAFAGLGGTVVSGEMAIREQGSGRLLPTALFSRWTAASAP